MIKWIKTFYQKVNLKKVVLKGLFITSTVIIAFFAPLTLPIFITFSICTCNKSYMFFPFMILDLNTILDFILNN